MNKIPKIILIIPLCFSLLISAAASDLMSDKEAVTYIQNFLNANGYDSGPADGILGDKTANAIRNYQADHGLEATGQISDQFLAEIAFDPSGSITSSPETEAITSGLEEDKKKQALRFCRVL